MAEWVNICSEQELDGHQYITADLDGTDILIFKINNEYFALEDVCTHDHICLNGGDVEDDEIICPHHGAHFNIKTGEATAPPANIAAESFPTQVVNGMIQIKDERWD